MEGDPGYMALAERRKLLLTMLEAVYVDTVDEKSIVSIHPNPAFQATFEIPTTRKGSDVTNKTRRPRLACALGRLIRVSGGDGL